MSKSLAGVAYSAGRAVQEVGQEGGQIPRKIRQTALPLWFRARAQAFKHAWRGVFCRARSGFQHDCLGHVQGSMPETTWIHKHAPRGTTICSYCSEAAYGQITYLLSENGASEQKRNPPAWMLLIECTRNTDVIMVPAWMLLIERTRNTDVIMVPARMLLIERTRHTDVIMVPARMLLIERTRNTDVIMVPAWMLLIERTTTTDVIMVPAWMLLIKRTRNTDVIMVPAWMLLIETY